MNFIPITEYFIYVYFHLYIYYDNIFNCTISDSHVKWQSVQILSGTQKKTMIYI